MSRSAFSAKVFAIYLFVVGAVLVIAPNFLLSIFRLLVLRVSPVSRPMSNVSVAL